MGNIDTNCVIDIAGKIHFSVKVTIRIDMSIQIIVMTPNDV